MFTPETHPHLHGWVPNPEGSERIFGALPKRRFQDAAPHLMDTWDGKSNVLLWQSEVKVLGHVLPAQKQDRGTCCSRGTTGAVNRRQILQIALGLRNDVYTPTSHAFIYAAGRKRGNMLGTQDGCYGAAMLEAVSKDGICSNADASDDELKDDLAVKWGRTDAPSELYQIAAGHKSDIAQVRTFNEAANALFNGHLVIVCSDQGFTMTRDSDGFCSPQGSWAHCMHFIGVFVTSRGRRGLVCAQSWGENCPDGPRVFDQPSYTFGVDEHVADRMLGQNDSGAIASVNGWPSLNIPWIFS